MNLIVHSIEEEETCCLIVIIETFSVLETAVLSCHVFMPLILCFAEKFISGTCALIVQELSIILHLLIMTAVS